MNFRNDIVFVRTLGPHHVVRGMLADKYIYIYIYIYTYIYIYIYAPGPRSSPPPPPYGFAFPLPPCGVVVDGTKAFKQWLALLNDESLARFS